MTERFVVRIDRSEGSRTYKGPWDFTHCAREAAAWSFSFPDYEVAIVPFAEANRDMKAWSRAINQYPTPYYPQKETSCSPP